MIDHRRDSRRLPRPLYLMAKPEAGVRDHIHGLARTQRSRPAGLLHVTLLALIDLAVAPMALEAVLAAMAGFRGEEIRILFDRIVERRCVVLRGGRGTDAARGLQGALARHLVAHGFPFFGSPPAPHLTLRYGRDGRGDEAITPIGWG